MSFLESSRDWDILAIGEIPQATNWGESSDLRYGHGYTVEIFHRQKSEYRNCLFATSITLSSYLKGQGVGNWLTDRELMLCGNLTGPDPWLKGNLSPVDNDNDKRHPFWRRHVNHDV